MHPVLLHDRIAMLAHEERVARALAAAQARAARTPAPPRRLRIGRRVRVEVWLPLPVRDGS